MKTNAIQKMKNKFLYAKTKAELIIGGATLSLMTPSVHASGGGATNMVLGIAEIVVDIFPLVGIFFIIAGAFKLFLAYRNDQPEAQTGAAKDIVIGAVLVVFRLFAWNAIRNLLVGNMNNG